MSEIVSFTDWSWIIGVLGLVVAFLIYGYVKRQPSGSDLMIDLANQIHDGAMAFLRKEYTFLLVFVVVVAILLGLAISPQTTNTLRILRVVLLSCVIVSLL